MQRLSAPAAKAHAADHLALVAEQIFGDVPAPVLLIDEVALFSARVGEVGLAEGRVAADQLDRPRLHARLVHIEQNEADALVLRRVGISTDEAEDPVGLVGVAGPDLLTVDDIVIAPIHRLRLQAGEVGARARLRIALAPANLAADDRRQMLLLLVLGAELQQRRAEHPNAEAVQRRASVDARHFLLQHLRFGRRQAAAVIFLRPHRRCPAALRHPLQPDPLRIGREGPLAPAPAYIVVAASRLTHLRRAVLLQPCACLAAEGVEVGHVKLLE